MTTGFNTFYVTGAQYTGQMWLPSKLTKATQAFPVNITGSMYFGVTLDGFGNK